MTPVSATDVAVDTSAANVTSVLVMLSTVVATADAETLSVEVAVVTRAVDPVLATVGFGRLRGVSVRLTGTDFVP